MALISICIPTYEMSGRGVGYLTHSFNILSKQSFKDFDVVISDHSQNDDIKKLCENYSNLLDIQYHRNTEGRGSNSININNATDQPHIHQPYCILIKVFYFFIFKH